MRDPYATRYLPRRVRVHRELIEEFLDLSTEIAVEGRAVVVTAGPPAAGKSTRLGRLGYDDTRRRIDPDVFKTMLVRRKIDLKALDAGEPRLSGKLWKITATTQQGISQENAKKIAKLIRDEGPKGVRTQVQGDDLRVFSKKRDDLQTVQRLITGADFEFAVQFDNYR